MNILITGATGFIGQALGQKLVAEGHRLFIVSREKEKAQAQIPYPAEVIQWDLLAKPLNDGHFDGIEVVIHLLGESINGRWTAEKKKKILQTREISSRHLLQNIPPSVKTVISVSGQGIYGDRADEVLTEESTHGQGFLADVCEVWEKPFGDLARQQLSKRVVTLRLGLVMSSRGGALRELISLFQKNLGATLGSGQQWMSWISLQDVVEVLHQAVENPRYRGVINAVSPNPVQNSDFTRVLCKSLNVFSLPSVPRLVLKAVLGQMAALVLESQRVSCEKLQQLGFRFQDPGLETFLTEDLKCFKDGFTLLHAEQFIAAPPEKVFPFFAEAHNLEDLTPPTLKFQVVGMSTPFIQQGSLIDYNLKIHGVPVKWKTLIDEWSPPHQFVDRQLKGPYKQWHHTHHFRAFAGGTLMTDDVHFKLPLGFLGRITAGPFVESDVGQIFAYRRQRIARQKF